MVTLHCSDREDGTRVRVVDTPGVMDTVKSNDQTLAKIYEAMSLCPNGFNALILVMKFGCRYTKEEKDSLNVLKTYFGSTFLKDFGIVIMTKGDSFDLEHANNKMTFRDWLELQNKEQGNQVAQVLQECNGRCVLFYNIGKKFDAKKNLCVTELLNIVKAEIHSPYNSEHIREAKVMREKVINKLNTPILHTTVQERLSLLIEQIQRDIKNKTLSYEATLAKLNALDKEFVSVKGGFKELTQYVAIKASIDNIRSRLQQLRSIKDKNKQNDELMIILKELEIWKVLPEECGAFTSEFLEVMQSTLNIFKNSLVVPKERENESKCIIDLPLD
ncbi:unnamed protein product [Lymnaea stagnalis]|uniref:AIG1-type G domain-containing protein n=1 Tax=Lymnaea stagnalis TaxID=6523 RepID=A0AAV2I0F4_LYMST